MMELGACVCTVHQAPACADCPIQQHCHAYADVQQYLADSGDPADTDMPLVTQYPAKVRLYQTLPLSLKRFPAVTCMSFGAL